MSLLTIFSYRRALGPLAAALALAGCSSNGLGAQSGAPVVPSQVKRAGDVGNYNVVAVFPKTATGAQYPSGKMVEIDGKLFGIAQGGNDPQDGTIFSLVPNQAVKTVYRFHAGANDGYGPNDDLISAKAANGDEVIYGTTQFGGTDRHGTIFSYDPKIDKETVLYSFHGNADGGGPGAGVIYVDGALYGTTRHAGQFGKGGLFKFRLPNGKAGLPEILHQFGKMPDASDVEAPLFYHDGMLWGVSKEGGEFKGPHGSFDNGFGAIFKFGLDGSGGQCGSANGDDLLAPSQPIVNTGGTLVSVGDSFNDPNGFIYALNGCAPYIPRPAGRFPAKIGNTPSGGLVTVPNSSNLFGVLFYGGPDDAGAVYKFDRMSFETAHAFIGKRDSHGLDGCRPESTPVYVRGTIYGTTKLCGKDEVGIVWSWN